MDCNGEIGPDRSKVAFGIGYLSISV